MKIFLLCILLAHSYELDLFLSGGGYSLYLLRLIKIKIKVDKVHVL